jgi:hypothetical protein
MNIRRKYMLLALYDLVLSVGAFVTGAFMLRSGSGIFSEYPKEWLTKLPFDSWAAIGIISIVIFGLGNLISSFACFLDIVKKPWLFSVVMGGVLLCGMVIQRIILGEWYLATLEFIILSIVQISLSIYGFLYSRRS